MLFNSAQFLFGFLPVAFLVFFLLGLYSSRKLALGWLAIASLAFYSWDDPFRLLPIILSSITFNFIIGRILVRGPNRGALAIGLFGNLLLLGYFKYAGFLAEIVTTGSGIVVQNPNVVLPIGISFFTCARDGQWSWIGPYVAERSRRFAFLTNERHGGAQNSSARARDSVNSGRYCRTAFLNKTCC